ncbi:hypothetical protein PIB30_004715 [Stylosanthes scabra]|uniref:Uncharacterized protein n=1 Tax=Stylosanthes scabra TaxID=79078 RepID=A0ABU6R2P6_9FABA|nr:hypothetical protein [Stylosanthes scabra]
MKKQRSDEATDKSLEGASLLLKKNLGDVMMVDSGMLVFNGPCLCYSPSLLTAPPPSRLLRRLSPVIVATPPSQSPSSTSRLRLSPSSLSLYRLSLSNAVHPHRSSFRIHLNTCFRDFKFWTRYDFSEQRNGVSHTPISTMTLVFHALSMKHFSQLRQRGARSDLYIFGVILRELATEKIP